MEMTVESMEMAPGAIPRPGRVPEQRLLSPELGFAMTAATELFFHEKVTPRNFLGQRLLIGEEATRGGARSGQT